MWAVARFREADSEETSTSGILACISSYVSGTVRYGQLCAVMRCCYLHHTAHWCPLSAGKTAARRTRKASAETKKAGIVPLAPLGPSCRLEAPILALRHVKRRVQASVSQHRILLDNPGRALIVKRLAMCLDQQRRYS